MPPSAEATGPRPVRNTMRLTENATLLKMSRRLRDLPLNEAIIPMIAARTISVKENRAKS